MSAEDVVVLETGSAGGAVRETETGIGTETEIERGIEIEIGRGTGTGGEARTEGDVRGKTTREWILTIDILGAMPAILQYQYVTDSQVSLLFVLLSSHRSRSRDRDRGAERNSRNREKEPRIARRW